MKTELARQLEATARKGESARTRDMALLDAYYHGCQYDQLPRAWHEDLDSTGQPIPFRSRRPSTILPYPRIIVDVYVRALWGAGRRPKATLADGEQEDNAFLDDIIAEARLYRAMKEATRRALAIGTGLIVWRLDAGRLRADVWDAKFADPVFIPGSFPELASVDYRFQYTREVRDAQTGQVRPVKYWHRERIDATTWTVYADVEVTAAQEPTWSAAETREHGLGFVPAVWFTIGERGVHDRDGTGIYAAVVGLFDEINYTASQRSRSLYYNLDPQTVLSGVDERDLDGLVKNGRNTWCLPKEAEAKLLESSGGYIEQATRSIEELKKAIYDATGVVLPDPERVSGAQSGVSLELLAAPQSATVDDLRDDVGDAFIRLLEQILRALTSPGLSPDKARIDVRDGKPRKTPLGRVVLSWGSHFPSTPTDAQTAAEAVTKATSAGVLSRPAGARYVARFFGVEDVEADQKLVEADQKREDQRAIGLMSRQAVAEHRRFAGLEDDDHEDLEDAEAGDE